jgi:hypothetical protein
MSKWLKYEHHSSIQTQNHHCDQQSCNSNKQKKSLNPAQWSWDHIWHLVHWIHFVGVLYINTKASTVIFLFRSSFLRTPLHNCLDFRDFSWLPLNNLLRLADLRCAFTSDSNWAFTGVSVKRALISDFLLRVSKRPSFWGKPDVIWTYVMLISFTSWESCM